MLSSEVAIVLSAAAGVAEVGQVNAEKIFKQLVGLR
jgi:hypothetical protein